MQPAVLQSLLLGSPPFLPEDDVATSSNLQQFSAVSKLTRNLQQEESRHPKQSQLPPGEADTPTKSIAHKAVYKQQLNHYNEALEHYDQYTDQLLSEQATELTKNTNFPNSIPSRC